MRIATAFALLLSPLLVLADLENAFQVPSAGYGPYQAGSSSISLAWTPSTNGTITLVLRSGSSTDLEAGQVMASHLPNNGAYTWQVPAGVVQGLKYTVEIVDDTNGDNMNYTPYFTIDSTVTSATTTSSYTSGVASTTVVSGSSGSASQPVPVSSTTASSGAAAGASTSAESVRSSLQSSATSTAASLSSASAATASSTSKSAASATSATSAAASATSSVAAHNAAGSVTVGWKCFAAGILSVAGVALAL